MYQVTCPTCFKSIPAVQSYEGTYVCSCGAKVRTKESSAETAASGRIWIVLLGLLIIVGFIHASNWDNYSVEIIPLKTKQILKLATPIELRQIADICEDRKKFFCQETALIEASLQEPKDRDLLLQIAALQMTREAFAPAQVTLGQYFKLGGKDRLARYQLGLALWKLGQIKDAKKHLHYLVFSSKKSLDAQAARTYVSLLMSEKDFASAQKVIKHCRSLGNNTAMFLEREWKEIQKELPRSSS
jgi:hypothetical protein